MNGEVAKNSMHIYIPYRYKVEQPDDLQHNGDDSEMEMYMKCTCGSMAVRGVLKKGSTPH